MEAAYFILPLIGGLVLWLVIGAAVRSPGKALQRKFVSLGNMKGKSLSEISAVVGSPNAISARSDGGSLRQWQATGYHIALIFDAENICQGITHQASV
jgi:hypothetical protein